MEDCAGDRCGFTSRTTLDTAAGEWRTAVELRLFWPQNENKVWVPDRFALIRRL